MKAKILIILIFSLFAGTAVFSQEITKNQIKEEYELTAQKQTENLLSAKEFVFTGSNAYPTGYRSVNLTLVQNYVKFHSDLVECSMPYYGRANSTAAYSGSQGGGFHFEEKPENFTVTKRMNNYLVEADVKDSGENYHLSLFVEFNGSATLTIISLNRSPISYSGYISEKTAR